jgi:hypothetical protein
MHDRTIKVSEKYKRMYQIKELNFNTFQNSINESLSKTILTDHRIMVPEYCYKYGKQNTDSINVQYLVNKILLIIPELSCNTCYDDVYDFIRYANDSLDMKISILTSKNRYREITGILSDYSLQTDLYYIKTSHFIGDKDEIEFAPYFIFMDQHKSCYHLFIPQPNHPYLTKTYLTNISLRYESLLH